MQAVHKVTLSSGKIVLMRELKQRDIKIATKVAGNKAKDNQALLGVELQDEILRNLILEVDGKRLSAQEKETLDDHFSMGEYRQMAKFLEMMMEADVTENPKVEILTSSN